MKNESHKLDDLFKEKLSDMEIPLEEDYWPYIEQKVSVQPSSFYKFSWKHINIYNSSVLLLLIGAVCFFNIPKEQKTENNSSPANTGITTDKKDSAVTKDLLNKKAAPINTVPEIENRKTAPITPSSSGEELQIRDSIVPISKQEVIIPSSNQEPTKAIPEEKVKPKKIIYVVQQDTIVEKDTVKVRRRRKK